MRGRFAPSPTGPPHFGSLVAALGSHLNARHRGGRWLVRIEDLDTPRNVPGAADAILRGLERFAMPWDGEVVRQSERTDAYAEALDALARRGRTFPCGCSRRDLVAGVYPGTCRETLTGAQHTLFDIGAELAMPPANVVGDARVEALEAALDALNADLPPLKEFILPGGGAGACATHVARAVCRRAERGLVALAADEPVGEVGRRYVNRLSDYLFVAARVLARADSGEVYWKHERSRGAG